jgi:hypothetical protein
MDQDRALDAVFLAQPEDCGLEHIADDILWEMTANPQTEILRQQLLRAWKFRPTEEEQLNFSELNMGDLFRLKDEEYRKIPALEIPDLGERNAAVILTHQWVYLDPEKTVRRFGTTDLLVDRVRAGLPAAEDNQPAIAVSDSEKTERLKQRLTQLKLQMDQDQEDS